MNKDYLLERTNFVEGGREGGGEEVRVFGSQGVRVNYVAF